MKRGGQDGLNEFESRLVEIIYKHAKLKDSEKVARLRAEIADFKTTIEEANERIRDHNSHMRDALDDQDDPDLCEEISLRS